MWLNQKSNYFYSKKLIAPKQTVFNQYFFCERENGKSILIEKLTNSFYLIDNSS